MRLVATMDPSSLTIIGHWPPLLAADTDNPLLAPPSPSSTSDMTVVYCKTVVGGQQCNPPCTLYNGPGGVCLPAAGTNCLLATVDVAFCATADCSGAVPAYCNVLDGYCAGHAMQGGFCYTPDTNSISVPAHTNAIAMG
ncbi:hypothetical protein C8Q73DRAFT_268511 [Cubamyces lactineus]|nr:hypothetical protein C8Q73DRAFT_268511 [Cubamyces lactineus]